MALYKLSFLSTKKTKSPQVNDVRLSLFGLPRELRDRIFYFTFKDLRIQVVRTETPIRSHQGKRASRLPSPIESVPVLRSSKLHFNDVRSALLRHATIIVRSTDVAHRIMEDATLRVAIRKICMRPGVLGEPEDLRKFIRTVSNLASVTFPICESSTLAKRRAYTWELGPWAVVQGGQCEEEYQATFLQDVQNPHYRPKDWIQAPVTRYIAKWRKEVERKSEQKVDLVVEFNIWVKMKGSWRARIITDREYGLRAGVEHFVRIGWKSVRADMDLREGVLRFEIDGQSFAVLQERDISVWSELTTTVVC